jgi:hypothetical protein
MDRLGRLCFALAALAAVALAGCAHLTAQAPDAQAIAASLKEGGYVVVMRHGATNRDMADTDPLNLDNVAKQRHLKRW